MSEFAVLMTKNVWTRPRRNPKWTSRNAAALITVTV